ncbi:serrate RNA effector molecule homolog isoform X2 [Ptychodera flava]|uniref:serrate RNA effector molecule homolog isoform X2 n=1 Tax=Ptychodera flava TaxID=63121 RepID=UPI00396A42FB
MADSDEELYDRRRGRDKFRRERSDYNDRRDREDRNRRDDWGERRREGRDTGRHDWSRREYSDYDRRRDRYSPQRRDMSPPHMKRMRRDWDDSSYAGYDANNMQYSGGHQYGPPPGWGHPGADMPHQHMQQAPVQHQQGPRHGGDMDSGMANVPQMMTFKQFLANQDDSIDDQEAVKKYNEYKIEFKRQQLSDFFLAHKEEEWFRAKYHPDECGKRKEESLKALKNRRDVFLDLLEKGWLDKFTLDFDKQDEVVKFLDAAVIKMEGGTDHDLKVLDQPPSPVKAMSSPYRRNRSESESQPEKPTDDKSSQKRSKGGEEAERRGEKIDGEESEETKKDEEKKSDAKSEDMTPEQQKLAKMAEEYKKQQGDDEEKPEKKEEKPRKRRHEYSYDENDSGSGSESEDSEPEPAPPGVDPPPPGTETNETEKPKEASKEEEEEEEKKEKKKEEGEKDVEENKEKNDKEEKEKDTKETEKENKEVKAEPEEPQPRPLHKTYSLFMRNLAPLITKAEIAALCKRYPGFLRVALADPQPDRRFYRRGWITFDRSVNIKEICWNLNNIRLRDCELAPVVNRDLTRRIRPLTTGIPAHRPVVKNDIKTAAKLVQMADDKHGLWRHETDEKTDPQKESFLLSKNPVLENITDYLVDEASAEEDELLGTTSDPKEEPKDSSSDVQMERDEKLIKVLDRLIVYLRIVHSLDYYNACDYPNEDEMPNRCGIMHCRGTPPSRITQSDVTDWQNAFQQKTSPLLIIPDVISEEELVKLGKKDAEAEQTKFITANTQEVAKDKWLCPLSGKKFKGPEFVKKHILNKHADKLDDVKKEVAFFNNYLADPKRPQLPEPQTPKTPSQQSGPGGREGFNMGPSPGYQGPPQQGMMGYGQQRHPGMFGGGAGPGFGTPGYGGRAGYDAYSRGAQTYPQKQRSRSHISSSHRGPRNDPRELIQYRDLDAPDDMDYF